MISIDIDDVKYIAVIKQLKNMGMSDKDIQRALEKEKEGANNDK